MAKYKLKIDWTSLDSRLKVGAIVDGVEFTPPKSNTPMLRITLKDGDSSSSYPMELSQFEKVEIPLSTNTSTNTSKKYKILKTNKFSEPPFKVGDIVEGTLNSSGMLVVKRDFQGNKNVQFQFAKGEFAPETTTSTTPSTPSTASKSDNTFASLEKTGRKLQIGWTVAGWAIFGFLAYKYWNKSNLWKGIIATLGVANLYTTYKTFSKPSLSISSTSSKNEGESKGSVSDEKIIDALINSMKQLVVSMSASFGQDKDKASADFDRDFAQQKPQVIAKGKQILSTMKDNEKQAVYEIIIFETDLYSKSKTQEDAENIENKLNAKIQELSTKYSVDLKSALDKLKNSKF